MIPLDPVLIAGPTASGKSELALRLAEREGGVVINADASQVYACWRVLSARPDDADLARAPHRLYGHVAPGVRHSAGDWRREALDAIAVARRDGLRPIVVGGTGLYFSALTEGLSPIPPIPPEIRAQSEARLAEGLPAMLADLDNDRDTLARLDTANPMRVQRAWEVLAATGHGLAWWHAQAQPAGMAAAARIVVMPDTERLNQRINRRLQAMIAAGALDEVRRFLTLGVSPELPAARVIGARELAAHLHGDTSRAEAVEATLVATRQFAKRQRTWLRSRMATWTWIDPATRDGLEVVPTLSRPRK